MISFPVPIGNQLPLVVIGGVNVLEKTETSLKIAKVFKDSCENLVWDMYLKRALIKLTDQRTTASGPWFVKRS